MRRSIYAGLALLVIPAAALAFDTVDTLPYPSLGRFPAYPSEDARPTEMFVEGGVMHDSNLLRLQGGGSDDNVIRVGTGLRHASRLAGRQTIRLDGRVDYYSFEHFSELDHYAYNVGTSLLWELTNDLTGTLGYGRVHRIGSLTELRAPVKRTITTDDLFGTAAYRLGPWTRLRGALVGAHAERRTPGTDPTILRTYSTTVGADFVTTLTNSIGIEYRRSHGDAPVNPVIDPEGRFLGNDYHERETALVASYETDPYLRFTGRIGQTERTYTDLTDSNFKGTTWRAGVEWYPSNKLLLAFESYREPRAIIDLVATHSLVRAYSFGPSWAATAKLVFSLRAAQEHRIFIARENADVPSGTQLDETLRVFRFGIGWEPVRRAQIGVGVDRGLRESNTLNRNFNYTAMMINGRLTF